MDILKGGKNLILKNKLVIVFESGSIDWKTIEELSYQIFSDLGLEFPKYYTTNLLALLSNHERKDLALKSVHYCAEKVRDNFITLTI